MSWFFAAKFRSSSEAKASIQAQADSNPHFPAEVASHIQAMLEMIPDDDRGYIDIETTGHIHNDPNYPPQLNTSTKVTFVQFMQPPVSLTAKPA